MILKHIHDDTYTGNKITIGIREQSGSRYTHVFDGIGLSGACIVLGALNACYPATVTGGRCLERACLRSNGVPPDGKQKTFQSQ